MPNTDISVVIVNYNVKDFLYQCLRSIEKASQNLEVEIIVVDNHSVDNSVEYLKPRFPGVKFISLNDNLGFGRANNIGIEASSGKYTLILNPDTILSEDTLVVMKEYMDKNAEVGMAGCKVLNQDGSFQVACRRGFPSPWVAFTKLFGLQTLFPKSPIFARYNQTYRSEDETYYIDAIIGAFMFCRKSVLTELNGFDTDFFMYGEDLDLCYRCKELGKKIAYVHTTSIIHYKGESTKRSSINEVRHFYDAMKIFSKKHYGRSSFFSVLLKTGIFLRSVLAYLIKYKLEAFFIISDLLLVNFVLIFSTKIRFDDYFAFPDYAYPIVFVVISMVMFVSMTAVGEYFERRYSPIRAFFGLMASFFFLSSLTYFFKEFAFSRGVLLLTIGITTTGAILTRSIHTLFKRFGGKGKDRNIAIVGTSESTYKMISALQTAESRNAEIIGIISNGPVSNTYRDYPLIGDFEYLGRIIKQYSLKEVVICDSTIPRNLLLEKISLSSKQNVRFHIAEGYDELQVSRIIEDISGEEINIPQLKLDRPRYKIAKRLSDILLSLFFLTIGLPLLFFRFSDRKELILSLLKVLKGELSMIGIYPVDDSASKFAKVGLTSLADAGRPERLSNSAIKNLNEYYLGNYSLSLDIEIMLKFLFRKKSAV